MKLILAIMNQEDVYLTTEALNKNGFYVTKLASFGGFLKKATPLSLLEPMSISWIRQ